MFRETDTIQIKISGDRAKITNNSNSILLPFAILQTGESVTSAKGNRTIGIVNGRMTAIQSRSLLGM